MLKPCNFLIVGGACQDAWHHIVKEALAALGNVETVQGRDALKLTQEQAYDLIVIDAAKVEEVFSITASIRRQRPDAKIVIATASPTWEHARKAFRAGATDYIQKSMNKGETVSILQAAIDKLPPSWRR